MLGITLIVCRNSKGQYLSVLESDDRGWWLPGGRVDPPESFQQAAIRETIEEAGVHVTLKGILRLESNIHSGNFQRVRVVFYAEPIDENEIPKQKADKGYIQFNILSKKLNKNNRKESIMACWTTLNQLLELKTQKPGWRGSELYDWGQYIEQGGYIYPLSILEQEGSSISMDTPFTITHINNKQI